MDEWQKGEFGKPINFAPKVNAFRAICQMYAPEAGRLLWEMATDKLNHEGVRFQALKLISEQAYGKAPQSVDVKVMDNISPSMMTTEQLKLIAAGKIKELIFGIIQSGQIEDYLREHREALEAGNVVINQSSSEKVKQLS